MYYCMVGYVKNSPNLSMANRRLVYSYDLIVHEEYRLVESCVRKTETCWLFANFSGNVSLTKFFKIVKLSVWKTLCGEMQFLEFGLNFCSHNVLPGKWSRSLEFYSENSCTVYF